MSRLTIDSAAELPVWAFQPKGKFSTNRNVETEDISNRQESTDQRFRNRVNSLGIAVDNLTCEQALSSVFSLIEQYKIDKTPKLVATLNVDFLVNSLGYRFDKPRHPELLKILRKADVVTADGFPIVMLSKLCGFPLKERVTGADLAPNIARIAAQKGKSIYFMGGEGDSAKQAAKLLQKQNSGLSIAGVSAPYVAIDGENLASWDEDDLKTVKQINQSKADILFIGLGNPKQELWFARNQHRLNVPVSIGIGGTFSFITGDVKRAPVWMQKLNMEWVFRITQDPKRLIKRYAIGMAKFSFLAMPIVLQMFLPMMHSFMRKKFKYLGELAKSLFKFTGSKKGGDHQPNENLRTSEEPGKKAFISSTTLPWKIHWASKEDALKTLRLPRRISRSYLEALVTDIQKDIHLNPVIYSYMIDFSKVRSMAIGANEAFCELNRLFQSQQVNGLLIDLSKSLKKRLASARVMDVAVPNLARSNQIQDSIISQNNKQFKSYIVGKTCFSYFSGDITGEGLAKIGFEDTLLNVADERDCIIDLRRATNIDSAALAIMYRLAQAQKRGEIRPLRLSGINSVIRQMINIVGLDSEFICLSDKAFYDYLFSSNNKGWG